MTASIDRRLVGRRHLAVAAAIGGALLIGLGPVQAATVTVAAVNFEFQPASRSVRVGDVVRWTFSGDPHTVTSGTPGAPDGRFNSGIEDPGGSFQVTFDQPGTFRYFCQIHSEQMTGTIVVSAGSAPTPRPTAARTARPSAEPTPPPTARPTEAPTAAPSPALATPAESAPDATTPPSTTPATALPSGATPAPTDPGPASPEPTVTPGNTNASAGIGPGAIVAGLIVIGLLIAGGLTLARRSERPR